jgi:AAA+ ATPase superfamily predicted ATPase
MAGWQISIKQIILISFLMRDQRRLLILDELPYAAEADNAMLSSLQHAWDQHFQHSQMVIVICGSHVRTMELLFGRMTGQWRLMPLPFGTLSQFLPHWSPEEPVATYAIVGGVPAYLAWLDPSQTLAGTASNPARSTGICWQYCLGRTCAPMGHSTTFTLSCGLYA